MTVRELVTKLGFEADDKTAKKYDQTLNDIRKTALKTVTAVTGLAAGAIALGKRLSNTGNEIAKAAREAGLAADEYQRLNFTLQQASRSTTADVDRALGRLNQRIGRARTEGGKYADILMRIGFTQEQIQNGSISTSDAFDRLTEAVSNANSAQDAAAITGEILGTRIGRRLAAGLYENRDAFLAIKKEAEELSGLWSKDALDASELLSDSFGRVSFITNGLTGLFAEKFLPLVDETISSTVEWFKANKEVIRQNLNVWLEGLVSNLRIFRSFIERSLAAIRTFLKFIGGAERALRLFIISLVTLTAFKLGTWFISVAKGVGILTFALRSLQRLGIILLLVALVAILEDIYVWIRGGESVIGRYIGSWENFKAVMVELGALIMKDLKKLWAVITNIFDEFLNKMGELVDYVLVEMSELWQGIKDRAVEIKDLLMGILDPIIEYWGGVWDVLMGIFTFDGERIMKGFASMRDGLIDGFKGMFDILADMVPDWLVSLLSGGAKTIKGLIEFPGDALGKARDTFLGMGNLFGSGEDGQPSNTERLLRNPANDMVENVVNRSSRNVTVNARTEATLQIPPGTSAQQSDSLRRQAEQIFRDHWDSQLRKSLNDYQPED